MLRRVFKKNLKAFVACATLATLLMTTAVPAGAANSQKDKGSIDTKVESTQKYRNVMYYGDWSVWGGQRNFYPQDIPADQLTHLNFAFMDFNADGSLKWTDEQASMTHGLGKPETEVMAGTANSGILNGFKELKIVNPNLKIGVSLGGWSKCGEFTAVAKNPQARKNFAKNLCDFIKYANMDFIDLDWEYPTAVREPDLCDNSRDEGTLQSIPEDKENYILLLQDIRDALNAQGKELNKTYELTVALPAPIQKVKDGIDVKRLFDIVDFANIMTYDMRGAWDNISGHQAGLYTDKNDPFKEKGFSVDESVKYYLSQGAPSNKVVIGAAYYTRGWEKVSKEGTSSSLPGLFGSAAKVTVDADGTPSTGANPEIPIKNGEGGRMTGVWSYNALDSLKARYPGLKEYWDDEAKAPYLYSEQSGAFFTYDNVRSIQEKVKYVKENNLGGMIAWMASQDKATTSTKRDELTKATKQALYGDVALTKYTVTAPNANVDTKIEAAPAIAGLSKGNGQLKITLKNTGTITTKDEVVSAVEKRAKTLMNPKLYLETDGIDIVGAQYPLTDKLITKENGKYVIDLSKSDIYTNRLIEPGSSIVLNLDTKQNIKNIEGVLGLSMEQKIYPSSPTSFGRQSLYGYDSDIVEYDSKGNGIPNISGVRKITTYVNEKFDKMAGVKAIDKEDGDITNKVVVTGNVNVRVPGTYELVYSVTDSNGATRSVKCAVTVDYRKKPMANTYDPNKTYDMRDANNTVIYNGAVYKCNWYSVKGIEPGTNPIYWVYVEEAYEIIPPPAYIIDLASVANAYNTVKGNNNYDEECDLNKDGIVDIYDLVIISKKIV
ncbi:glycosyl hydrolase family 18 protein [Clostridium paraputrificum]|uniref:glycosyl hydrolase family 18 protein n=1 Tax=Clostridium TaxID=1485 RepID=UPI003D331AC4